MAAWLWVGNVMVMSTALAGLGAEALDLDGGSDGGVIADQPRGEQVVPGDVRTELQALQDRIAQLEAEQRAAPPASVPSAPPIEDAGSTVSLSQTESAPFAFADYGWLNGNSRASYSPIDTKVFTLEFRADVSYIDDLDHPVDHTLDGTSESGRTDEFQLQQLGIGGDFHYDNVIGRVMTQFGMYSVMTPRNDASPTIGQWSLDDAYRYISEAYGGYHFDVLHGINVEAGIFMSYIGLFSYYNYDNWAYQPSYVSSNTPWFFNGARVQIFVTDTLKIEPWLINGWQSYAKFNNRPGFGAQVLWRPHVGWFSFVGNQYAYGTDTVGLPDRNRWHTDDSIEVKYYENKNNLVDRSAFSLTVDLGCENGGGVVCSGGTAARPDQYFAGFMLYDRVWLANDLFGITVGGGAITNPGRYLVLTPPINGATAAVESPAFTQNPGDKFEAWDATLTFDWMPSQFITFRIEGDYRAASVPYFVGHNGISPPGETNSPSGSMVPVGAPGSIPAGWSPDLNYTETRINMAMLVKL